MKLKIKKNKIGLKYLIFISKITLKLEMIK